MEMECAFLKENWTDNMNSSYNVAPAVFDLILLLEEYPGEIEI
jgi:hypothetical protein